MLVLLVSGGISIGRTMIDGWRSDTAGIEGLLECNVRRSVCES